MRQNTMKHEEDIATSLSAPGGISSLFTFTNTSIPNTPTSPDLCAKAGAVLQCNLCYENQDHEISDSPGPPMTNVSTNSFRVLGLHLVNRHFLGVPLSPFHSKEESLDVILLAS